MVEGEGGGKGGRERKGRGRARRGDGREGGRAEGREGSEWGGRGGKGLELGKEGGGKLTGRLGSFKIHAASSFTFTGRFPRPGTGLP